MKHCRYFFCLMALCSGLTAAAESLSSADSLRLLERIARAPMLTDFQGVYVQQQGEYMESIRVCHVVDGGVVSERRETLDGPPREMIRHGEQVSIYLPEGDRTKSFDPRISTRLFPRLLPDNPAEILASYTLRKVQRERIAGLEADVIEVEPKDRLRYAHRLWVHTETGLLLKALTLGFKREVYDLQAFSQLVLGAGVDRNQLKPVHPVRPVAMDSAPSNAAVFPVLWDSKALPAGFHVVQQSQRTIPGRNQPVVHHVFTDGLVTISVFIEPMKPSSPIGGTRQSGLSVYGRQEGSYHVTVLGKVPPETAELFSKAYKQVEKQGQK